jgi:DNA-binding NarL/FixJ family response regulator
MDGRQAHNRHGHANLPAMSSDGRPRQALATVLVASAQAATRAGLVRSLEGEGFSIVGASSDADEAIERALRCRPDVCLLDTRMPGSGIRAAREISERLPGSAVVMLATSESDADLFDGLRAGASGYLLMDTDPRRLPHALRGVLAGEAAIPRRLVARLVEEFRSQGRRRRLAHGAGRAELTGREWEVLELVRDGLTTREAAARLFVSPVTVRRHLSAITSKLAVADRAAAVRLLEETRI